MHHGSPSETVVVERRPLSTGAAAHRAGCDRATIRRAIESGELEAVRLGRHGNYRISREALDAWMQPTTRTEESKP